MTHLKQWWIVVAASMALALVACTDGSATVEKVEPAHVEHVAGSEINRITLTEKAAERLDLQTTLIRDTLVAKDPGMATERKVVPYESVIYDPHGETWAYTSPKPLTFVRRRIEVDYIEGNVAVLKEGPPSGTTVVTVGAAELFGTDEGVGH